MNNTTVDMKVLNRFGEASGGRTVKYGKWHSIQIRMKSPGYLVRARKEYLDK